MVAAARLASGAGYQADRWDHPPPNGHVAVAPAVAAATVSTSVAASPCATANGKLDGERGWLPHPPPPPLSSRLWAAIAARQILRHGRRPRSPVARQPRQGVLMWRGLGSRIFLSPIQPLGVHIASATSAPAAADGGPLHPRHHGGEGQPLSPRPISSQSRIKKHCVREGPESKTDDAQVCCPRKYQYLSVSAYVYGNGQNCTDTCCTRPTVSEPGNEECAFSPILFVGSGPPASDRPTPPLQLPSRPRGTQPPPAALRCCFFPLPAASGCCRCPSLLPVAPVVADAAAAVCSRRRRGAHS